MSFVYQSAIAKSNSVIPVQWDQDDADKVGKVDVLKVTPLHLATDRKMTIAMNIMMMYLAKLDYTQFKTFGRILPQLIEYSSFLVLLREQTFSTVQLSNKHNLRMEESQVHTADIVAFAENHTSYIDNLFYIRSLKESQNLNAN